MNGNPTNNNKEDPQDKRLPVEGTESVQRKKNKPATGNVNRTGNKQSQYQVPNWIMAIASILLVFVTFFYTYYAGQQTQLTSEGLDLTRDALTKNTEQFSSTLGEMQKQTAAAQTASDAARESAAAASRSAASAGKQVVAMKEQTNAAMEAIRLDQRAWLGYHTYVVQARENFTSTWKNREPKEGEQFRVRFLIQNVGKTPAFNVQLMAIEPKIIPIGNIPNEPEKWSGTPKRFVVFPNDDGLSHNTRPLSMTDQQFSAYSNARREIFFWAKLYYCDISGRRHWAQTGVAHIIRSPTFSIRSSSVSPDPGEADHPDCQN